MPGNQGQSLNLCLDLPQMLGFLDLAQDRGKIRSRLKPQLLDQVMAGQQPHERLLILLRKIFLHKGKANAPVMFQVIRGRQRPACGTLVRHGQKRDRHRFILGVPEITEHRLIRWTLEIGEIPRTQVMRDHVLKGMAFFGRKHQALGDDPHDPAAHMLMRMETRPAPRLFPFRVRLADIMQKACQFYDSQTAVASTQFLMKISIQRRVLLEFFQ